VSVDVRDAVSADAAAIAAIYNHFITNTIITFEEEPVTATEMTRRIVEVQGHQLPWLVAMAGNLMVGYAYATKWRVRHAYRFSTEVTVYLTPGRERSGNGSKLYSQLITTLQAQKIHTAIGVIALPNDASVALHEKLGFRKVAHLQEVGFKFNRWIDVGYWELVL